MTSVTAWTSLIAARGVGRWDRSPVVGGPREERCETSRYRRQTPGGSSPAAGPRSPRRGRTTGA
eukprot:5143645-Pyramimonas_sp.AAC.1